MVPIESHLFVGVVQEYPCLSGKGGVNLDVSRLKEDSANAVYIVSTLQIIPYYL